jgi:hypothetical protein
MKKKWAILMLAGFWFMQRASIAGVSQTTNGVYLAISGWRPGHGPITNEPINFDDELSFLAFCDSGEVELAYVPDTRYSMQIHMYDANGLEIPKTRAGSKVGSKFDELKSYKDTHTGVMIAGGSYDNNRGLGGGKALPTPKALFDLKQPGIYSMKIEMQMFVVLKSTNQWSRKLIRFSPITIAVEKPKE